MPVSIRTSSARIELTRGQGGIIYEDFEGPYEYDPLLTTQILPTADKHTTQNIIFNMIQTRETQLPTGGVQFDIIG